MSTRTSEGKTGGKHEPNPEPDAKLQRSTTRKPQQPSPHLNPLQAACLSQTRKHVRNGRVAKQSETFFFPFRRVTNGDKGKKI